MSPQPLAGPHQNIRVRNDQERFCTELLDALWDRYRQRVVHVRTYEHVIAAAGATFVNDHVAFRTFACQRPLTGIASVSRIFEALGYQPVGLYQFHDKHLSAIHFQHPVPDFPKLFISELKTWELDAGPREIIVRYLRSHRPALDEAALANLRTMNQPASRRAELLDAVMQTFEELPWDVPEKKDVESVNAVSQYAAWVLVHGYNVNHFTSLINSHQAAGLNDIEQTVATLRQAGIPMKPEIEGAAGSKLRQTATDAAVIDVAVRIQGKLDQMKWTYAYFELAERGEVKDPESGKTHRFEGFLGAQATNLFEMTKVQ